MSESQQEGLLGEREGASTSSAITENKVGGVDCGGVRSSSDSGSVVAVVLSTADSTCTTTDKTKEMDLSKKLSDLESNKFTKSTAFELADIWQEFYGELISGTDLLQSLSKLTMQLILSGTWMKVEEDVKTKLKDVIKTVTMFCTEPKLCTELVHLIETGPWVVDYLQPILEGSDLQIDSDLLANYFHHESPTTLKFRIEILCAAKEYEKASNLAFAAVLNVLSDAEKQGTVEEISLLQLDELSYQFGAISALLIYKLELDDKWSQLKDVITVFYFNGVIERLLSPDLSNIIAPKWKSGWKYADIAAQYSSERFLIEVLKKDYSNEEKTMNVLWFIKAIFDFWLNLTTKLNADSGLEVIKGSQRVAHYQMVDSDISEEDLILLNTIPIETIDTLPKLVSKQVLLVCIAHCIAGKFGCTKRPIWLKCIELCQIAILTEINALEQLRAVQYPDVIAIKTKEQELSLCYTSLAALFTEDVTTNFELVLTSFSLNPVAQTKEALDKLARQRTEESGSERWDPAIPSTRLTTSMYQTLCTIITNGRLACFNTVQPSWSYYEPLCIAHLNDVLSKKAIGELALARPDYAAFAGMAVEDEDDIIFEKGFEPTSPPGTEEIEGKATRTQEPKERLRSLKSKKKLINAFKLKRKAIAQPRLKKHQSGIHQQEEVLAVPKEKRPRKLLEFSEVQSLINGTLRYDIDAFEEALQDGGTRNLRRRESTDSSEREVSSRLTRQRGRSSKSTYAEFSDSDSEKTASKRAVKKPKSQCSLPHGHFNHFMWPSWTQTYEHLGTVDIGNLELLNEYCDDDDEDPAYFKHLTMPEWDQYLVGGDFEDTDLDKIEIPLLDIEAEPKGLEVEFIAEETEKEEEPEAKMGHFLAGVASDAEKEILAVERTEINLELGGNEDEDTDLDKIEIPLLDIEAEPKRLEVEFIAEETEKEEEPEDKMEHFLAGVASEAEKEILPADRTEVDLELPLTDPGTESDIETPFSEPETESDSDTEISLALAETNAVSKVDEKFEEDPLKSDGSLHWNDLKGLEGEVIEVDDEEPEVDPLIGCENAMSSKREIEVIDLSSPSPSPEPCSSTSKHFVLVDDEPPTKPAIKEEEEILHKCEHERLKLQVKQDTVSVSDTDSEGSRSGLFNPFSRTSRQPSTRKFSNDIISFSDSESDSEDEFVPELVKQDNKSHYVILPVSRRPHFVRTPTHDNELPVTEIKPKVESNVGHSDELECPTLEVVDRHFVDISDDHRDENNDDDDDDGPPIIDCYK